MTDSAPEQLATIPTVEDAVLPNGVGDLDIVRIYNETLDAYAESPRAGVRQLQGWVIVDPTPAEAEQTTTYDPSTHSRDEVLEFFATASDAEVEAVQVLEAAEGGKQRTTVLNWVRPEEPDGA